jgi:hypothetical protein
MNSPDNLTLRSIAQRCVSKGGNAHLACCPSFETRRFAAFLRMRSVLELIQFISGQPLRCRFRRKPATYSDLIAATLPI